MTVVSTIPQSPSMDLDRKIILNIFSSIGRCRFLDEKHFDACTALSGSGPAFACIFLEAMADGGVMMGLPRAEALELAAQSGSRFVLCMRVLIYHLRSFARSGAYDSSGRNTSSSTQGRCYKWVTFDDMTLLGLTKHMAYISSRRMYHCWVASLGRWQGTIDYCSCYPSSH